MDNNTKASNGASVEQKKVGKRPVGLKDVDEAEIVKDMQNYEGVAIDCVMAEFQDNVKTKETEGSSSTGNASDGSTHVSETTTVGAVGTQYFDNLQQAILSGDVVTISAKGAKSKAKEVKETEKADEEQK